MRLSRRSFVRSGAAAGLAVGAPALAATETAGVVIYDSRLPQSLAFALGSPARRLDVAALHGERWKPLRDSLPPGRIRGLTRWSDYVLARGLAQDQRRRLISERRVGTLIAWEMA